MARFQDQEFRQTTEVIDGNTYERCKFVECKIVYRGGPIPIFSGCNLERCAWVFEEAAKRTIALLKGINSGMGPGGRQLVEQTIQEIRTPFPKS